MVVELRSCGFVPLCCVGQYCTYLCIHVYSTCVQYMCTVHVLCVYCVQELSFEAGDVLTVLAAKVGCCLWMHVCAWCVHMYVCIV